MNIAKACALLIAATVSLCWVSPARSETPTSHEQGLAGSVHFNALGPLQFGLTPTLELGTRRASGLLRLRWMNPGLLSQGLPKEGGDEELAFSYGAALGVRYYTAPATALDGLHLGVWGELLRVRIEDSKVDREAYNTLALVPQIEAGYRFRFGSFLLGLGGALGYALPLSKETEDLSGGEDPVLREVDFEGQPYGSVQLDVGLYF